MIMYYDDKTDNEIKLYHSLYLFKHFLVSFYSCLNLHLISSVSYSLGFFYSIKYKLDYDWN